MSRNVTVELDGSGERIELRGWVGPDTPTKCKSVGGGRWNPGGKFWSYPLNMATCRKLREVFGAALSIGPELNAWAKDAVLAEAKLTELASATDAELVNVERFAPAIAKAMSNRTYQRVAAAFGARVGNYGLFDQPGLGKTIETLGALVEARAGDPGVFLVLSPRVAVHSVWAGEIAQWLGDSAEVFAVTGTRAQRQETLDAALAAAAALDSRSVFVVANIEMVRVVPWFDMEADPGRRKPKFKLQPDSYTDAKGKLIETGPEWPELFTRVWDAVIVDESQRALIRTSGTPTQTRAGMMALAALSEQRIALSGTPMRGKPAQLWGTLNWLEPKTYTSYWAWVGRYFELLSNRYSSYVLGDFLPGGEQRLADDMRSISLRRTKGEVLPELPPKQYAGTYLIPGDENSPHAVWLEMDPKQVKLYQQLVAEGAVQFDDGNELIADGILAQRTREKQLAGSCGKMVGGKFTPTLPSPKFDWLVAKLDELGILPDKDGKTEGDAKIVVASQFTSLLNTFAAELTKLGVRLHLLTGETSEKSRQAMVKDFQTDQTCIRLFMLNTKAGGVAVTLDAADDLVLLDETYDPDDQEQVEDRTHRTSRMHNVTIHNLRMLDTIEEEIAWVTAARGDVMKYLLDGSRGVETARALYAATVAA